MLWLLSLDGLYRAQASESLKQAQREETSFENLEDDSRVKKMRETKVVML